MTDPAQFALSRDSTRIAFWDDGPATAPAVVFAHALGTNSTLWDPILPLLNPGLRIIRFDLRGHGRSDVPDPPYAMGQLIADAEAVCDKIVLRDVVFVGLSVGGMIAQGLAIKRPDLVRAMVLSNTAAKIGHPKLWQDRISFIQTNGMAAGADAILKRWFGKTIHGTPQVAPYERMLTTTTAKGYAGVCAAIAGTDLYTPTSGLRIPTLGIAGGQDMSTPPDLVRETIDLIPGSQFALIAKAGHLPLVEQPLVYAEHINQFLAATGHLHVD